MKTVSETLIAAGPLLEGHWNAHSEIADGAARAATACAEALNDLKMEPTLHLRVAGLIMEHPRFPNNWEGVRAFWKNLIRLAQEKGD